MVADSMSAGKIMRKSTPANLSKAAAKKKASHKLAKSMITFNLSKQINEFNKNLPEYKLKLKRSGNHAINLCAQYIIDKYGETVKEMHRRSGKSVSKTCTSMKTIVCCTKLLMPGELRNHAVLEAMKANAKYSSSLKKSE
ncbi:MAG: hypothetical protein MHMPM18_000891 [Marteilia pararefringens]